MGRQKRQLAPSDLHLASLEKSKDRRQDLGEPMYVTREEFVSLQAQIQALVEAERAFVKQQEFAVLKTQVQALTEAFAWFTQKIRTTPKGPCSPDQSSVPLNVSEIVCEQPTENVLVVRRPLQCCPSSPDTAVPRTQTLHTIPQETDCTGHFQLKQCSVVLEDYRIKTENGDEGGSVDFCQTKMPVLCLKEEVTNDSYAEDVEGNFPPLVADGYYDNDGDGDYDEERDFSFSNSVMEISTDTDFVASVSLSSGPQNLPLDTSASSEDAISGHTLEKQHFIEAEGTYSEMIDEVLMNEANSDCSNSDLMIPENLENSSDFEEIPLKYHPEIATTWTCQNQEQLMVARRPGVTSRAIRRRPDGRRKFDKRHYCVYCRKPNSKISRHLVMRHSKEPEVAKVLKYPKGSKERAALLDELRNKGNYKHNVEVIREGDGELITSRTPSSILPLSEFLPCPHCLAFLMKKDMWRHVRSCKMKPDTESKSKRRVVKISSKLVPLSNDNVGAHKEVLHKMKQDEVLEHVKNDTLIQKVGDIMYVKLGTDKSQHMYIAQKMRELGRFVLCVKELDDSITCLRDVINRIDLVVEGAKKVGAFDPCTNTFSSPSLVLRLGYALKSVGEIVAGEGFMNDDGEAQGQANSFIQFMDTNWNSLVSAHAFCSLQQKEYDKEEGISLAEDVRKLQNYLQDMVQKSKQDLADSSSPAAWGTLCEALLTEVILYNYRRERAAAQIQLESYANRNSTPLSSEVFASFSRLEQELCNNLSTVIVGFHKVPVLLTKQMVESLKLLIQTREKVGIPKENPYLFAKVGGSTYFRASDCLHKYVNEVGTKHPEHITSRNHGKYVATLSQVMNLKSNEADEVAKIIGCSVECGEYYRLSENTLQLTHVAKLLLDMERGISTNQENSMEKLEPSTGGDDEQLQCTSHLTRSQESGSPEFSHTGLSPDGAGTLTVLQKQKKRKRRWSDVEQKAVKYTLQKFISQGKVPGKAACVDCLRENPETLHTRTWTDIKYYVKNAITQNSSHSFVVSLAEKNINIH